MDAVTTAAARALAGGDPLGALNRVALREDPPALALRGIAMAQLGDLETARALLRRAARAFGPGEPVARARCILAEAEIALVSRDLRWPEKALAEARGILEARGDRMNADHARHLEARSLLLLGRLDEAEQRLASLESLDLPPASRAIRELVAAGIAMRRLRSAEAGAALSRAEAAARASGIPGLEAEVRQAARLLEQPAARLHAADGERLLTLAEVEALLASDRLVVDACRNVARAGEVVVGLAGRPVLFALARALAEAWPDAATREALLRAAFRAREADESHRARLRVEIGRLRKALRPLAGIEATREGFRLAPLSPGRVVLLAWPVEEPQAALLALLADGEAWSSSALALATGASQRSVQRGLEALARAGKAQSFGRGPARRWTTPPLPGITTTLLLPGSLPGR